jgi:F0F1-type ATP synthase delta subunit
MSEASHYSLRRSTALGETYAAALLPLASARDAARSTLEELERALALLEQVDGFEVWAKHPGVPAEHKIKVIENAFRGHVSDLTCDVLVVICRHGRLGKIAEIVVAYRKLVEQA